MASQLGDLAVTRTNSTTLSLGANCSTATPCNVRFGSSTFSLTTPASVVIIGGAGTAFIYVDKSGNLSAGLQGITGTCSGCTITQVTSFPPDSLPIYAWTASNNSWDTSGGFDQRAFLSTKNVKAGNGLIVTDESLGQTTLGADPSVISFRTAVPATSSSACTAGSWALDTNFYYICVSQNSWRRISLSTF